MSLEADEAGGWASGRSSLRPALRPRSSTPGRYADSLARDLGRIPCQVFRSSVVSEVARYLQCHAEGRPMTVDWTTAPWSRAQHVLYWLRVAPEPAQGTPACRRLTEDELATLGGAACETLGLASPEPSWSSYMLETLCDAASRTVDAVPEWLLVAIWNYIGEANTPLTRVVFNFCKALGTTVSSTWRTDPGWDLAWCLAPGTDAQVCLSYWLLANRPGLFTPDLQRETQRRLAKYPYE